MDLLPSAAGIARSVNCLGYVMNDRRISFLFWTEENMSALYEYRPYTPKAF